MKNILSIQSHVVFGHAGNSAAEFPMQRMGVKVWSLNTVQFSNHTQYSCKWTGLPMPDGHLKEIVQGIENTGHLKECNAVLSGYLGSPEQAQEILDIVKQVKVNNPGAIYFCDPVMAHPEKGCFVAPGISEFIAAHVIEHADIAAPNLFELEMLTGETVNDLERAIYATQKLTEKGPGTVLVKHLGRAGKSADFEMLLVTTDDIFHISRPLVEFPKQPVGVGDLTSGLLLTNLIKGMTPQAALEHMTAAVYEVMLQTADMQSYELELVAAQGKIVCPEHWFNAVSLK